MGETTEDEAAEIYNMFLIVGDLEAVDDNIDGEPWEPEPHADGAWSGNDTSATGDAWASNAEKAWEEPWCGEVWHGEASEEASIAEAWAEPWTAEASEEAWNGEASKELAGTEAWAAQAWEEPWNGEASEETWNGEALQEPWAASEKPWRGDVPQEESPETSWVKEAAAGWQAAFKF